MDQADIHFPPVPASDRVTITDGTAPGWSEMFYHVQREMFGPANRGHMRVTDKGRVVFYLKVLPSDVAACPYLANATEVWLFGRYYGAS